MYSIQCQNCSEDSPVIVQPVIKIEDLNPQKCDKCQQRPDEDTLEAYLQIKAEVEESLDRSDLPQGEPEKCIQKMKGLVYPQHILYVKASELAFEDSFCDENWIDAIEYGTICIESYKKYTVGNQQVYNLVLM